MPEQLSITVTAGGEDANARAFSAVLGDVLDMLDAIAKDMPKQPEGLTWRIIALEKHSPPRVTIASAAGVLVLGTFLSGIERLQAAPVTPFNVKAVQVAKRLGERIGKEVDSVVFEVPGQVSVSPTAQMARNAAQVLAKNHYELPSSVDGQLDIVNIHAHAKFSIFDDITGHEVRCKFPPELLDLVKRNLGKRVTAVGIVKFNSHTDRPVSIAVQDIEPLDDGPEPKTFGEMPPIDVTGGLSSEEYVRQLRDGR